MNRLRNFLKALRVFLMMYKDGFYFSKNTHPNKGGGHWGFYRFNSKDEVGLFDIDFDFDHAGYGYFHVHGDDFRLTIKRSEPFGVARIKTRLKK